MTIYKKLASNVVKVILGAYPRVPINSASMVEMFINIIVLHSLYNHCTYLNHCFYCIVHNVCSDTVFHFWVVCKSLLWHQQATVLD